MADERRVVVTGGAGFIGSHLVAHLLAEQAWRVTVIDNFDDFYDSRIKRRNIAPHLANPRCEVIEADIRDGWRVDEIFAAAPPECVVHLAARAGVRPSLEMPHVYVETNITGTLNLLEASRKHEVRQFVFGSSSSVYGARSHVPFSEDDSAAHPVSPYAATKAAGELLCHTYARIHGLRSVCLRFFTVYGARQRPDLAIHKFARAMRAGSVISLYGDGSTQRDYTYIDDIIAGVRAAMDYSGSEYEIINLGNSRTVSLRDLITLIEDAMRLSARLEHLPEQPGDAPLTCADIAKARRLLNYSPRISIEEGIRRFVEWLDTEAD